MYFTMFTLTKFSVLVAESSANYSFLFQSVPSAGPICDLLQLNLIFTYWS